MFRIVLIFVSALAFARAACGVKGMNNLVTFGDSYTDESRLGYFINNKEAPPPGLLLPESSQTATGGYAWGRLVAQKAKVDYYNYAVSGATCCNDIAPRYFELIDADFPSVLEYETLALQADTEFPELYPDRFANNTVYALWIGTNDLGVFLLDSQVEGKSLTSFVECNWDVFDNIYASGGRQFVLMNVVPLEVIPLYADLSNGGIGDSQYWKNKTAYNTTEYQNKMFEYTTSVNTMFDYGAPFQLNIQDRWPGAKVCIYDTNALFLDMYQRPEEYFDAPANSTGFYRVCPSSGNGDECVNSPEPKTSFLWYDELHPSQRASEIVAENFINVVKGDSKYGTCYGAAV